jgi:signal transduction histidine kinase
MILALFVVIALWALEQGTEAALQSRATVARIVAAHADDVLNQVVESLRSNIGTISLRPGSPLAAEQRQQLASLRRQVSVSTSLTLLARDGTVLWYDFGDAGSMVDVGSRQVERIESLAPGQPRVSETRLGSATHLRVELPLADESGRITGVLVADVDPAHPSLSLLPGRGLGQESDVELISVDGRFIAGVGPPSGGSPQYAQRSAQEHALLIARSDERPSSGYLEHAPPNGPAASRHVVAYASLALLPRWMVTVEQPLDEVMNLPDRVRWYLGAFCGVTLGLVMTLAFLDVRRILTPIRGLTTSAERLASGCFDRPIVVSGTDELGELASAFESMRVRLHDAMRRERDVAVLEERARIAGEMHDGLGQVLGYVITKSLAVGHLIDVGETRNARTQVDQLEAAVREAYADVRENILALRTTLAPDRDLAAALREYGAGYQRQTGIAVTLSAQDGDVDGRLEPAAQMQLLRISQEALTNVRKHAGAQHVVIQLTFDADRVSLVVEDDGHGFDAGPATAEGAPHFGLEMMRERAESIGGTLAVVSETGRGTRVAVSVLRRPEGETHA